jgi:hypothetical protein
MDDMISKLDMIWYEDTRRTTLEKTNIEHLLYSAAYKSSFERRRLAYE